MGFLNRNAQVVVFIAIALICGIVAVLVSVFRDGPVWPGVAGFGAMVVLPSIVKAMAKRYGRWVGWAALAGAVGLPFVVPGSAWLGPELTVFFWFLAVALGFSALDSVMMREVEARAARNPGQPGTSIRP